MLLLQVHRRLTAHEMAERLEVSERTIHRDMEALSGAGIPVIAERGAGGGWKLLEGWRTNLTGLTEAEIQSLFIIRPSRLLADLHSDKDADSALLKLLAALPAIYRRSAEQARRRIHVDVTGWHRPEEAVPLLSTLQEAVWQERKLRFTYDRGQDCTVERLAEPLGLVAKGSVWYLVAAVEGDIRSYRVSRILEASVLEEHFLRPEDFDLAAFWQRSAVEFKARLPQYIITVRAVSTIIPRMYYAGRFARVEQVDEPDADGWARVQLRFQFEEEACEYVLGFGPQIEVLEPPALREKVMAAARSVIEFYAQT
jgi:predicted DNA-binding transcriptional regulator YafY